MPIFSKLIATSAAAAAAFVLAVSSSSPAVAYGYASGVHNCPASWYGQITVTAKGSVRVYAPGDRSTYGETMNSTGYQTVTFRGARGGGLWAVDALDSTADISSQTTFCV
ncbi:hypothetical protein Agsp01_31900 [Agromyces sp. NBRC 114283]|nr:hypothetical protein Agsp01_31900 [Agromyces sp. NBRC 114283]